jgi:hypothetical protein
MGWLDAVDRFVARVIFDSRVQPMAVRSPAAEVAERINLTCEIPAGEIDLQAERTVDARGQNCWQLIGQLGGSVSGEIEVALVKAGTTVPVAQAFADEHGGFALEAPPGAYDLCFNMLAGVVIIQNLKLS